MAKEMIVSVNGREKKIAILENGKVIEFYIERGEENSGVVGNIYKGRVQRVLPGMQSAFVDIGLERDAFLYVSDFFDEEEEFERIVTEKAQKSDVAQAEKAAAERLKQARLERERAMEAAQERAEPLIEKNASVKIVDDIIIDDIIIDDGTVTAVTEVTEEEKTPSTKTTLVGEGEFEFEQIVSEKAAPVAATHETAEILTPFVEEDSNFERIVDDETEGDLFKDARIQERLTDQVRAVEFEIEPIANVAVGTLRLDTDANRFERIADEEETETPPPPAKPEKTGRGGKRGVKTESAAENRAKTAEDSAEKQLESSGSNRKKQRGGKRRAEKSVENAETASENQTNENQTNEKSSRRRRRGAKSVNDEQHNSETTKELSDQTSAANERADASASVEDAAANSFREEMAVRRGGRRRRGGGNRQRQHTNGEISETNLEVDNDANFDAPENLEDKASTDARHIGGNTRGTNALNRERGEKNERRERRPPTISELLREGQEILVQIAKEPIAKKGARITSHIALPGRFLVYMPTIDHAGVSRKIESSSERLRLRNLIQKIRAEENVPSGGFIVRTAGIGISEQDLRDDARYLVRTWLDIRKVADRAKPPALVHQDLDLAERLLRDQLSDDFAAIRVDDEAEYLRIVEFVNRIQPRMTNRVKLYTREQPIMEAYSVQEEIDKAVKPRVWLKSGGYLVINQTEALVSIDVNTGKFVGGKGGGSRLEDTITKTNMEAVEEIARQIRLRDLGGIIVLDLIDMDDKKNRQRVLQALQEALAGDKSPTKVLSFNDFGLIVMTRKRVKQSLERTLCAPCHYCQGAGLIKSPQTVAYEILAEARRLAKGFDDGIKQTTLRVHTEVAKALRSTERDVLTEIEEYLGAVDLTADANIHQEQFDFAFV
jgi:Rne/Rng family ribonuclease